MRVTGDNAGALLLLLLRQVIPCILHCENRCEEKFLKMFPLEIVNHFAGETKLQDEFLKQFEDYVNLNRKALDKGQLVSEHYPPEFKQRKDHC
jgi:hypothetical protein